MSEFFLFRVFWKKRSSFPRGCFRGHIFNEKNLRVFLENVCPRVYFGKKNIIKNGHSNLKKRSPLGCIFEFIYLKEKKSPLEVVLGFMLMKKKRSPLDRVFEIRFLKKKMLPRWCFWIKIFFLNKRPPLDCVFGVIFFLKKRPPLEVVFGKHLS